MDKMLVREKDEQENRVMLYGDDVNYSVIASLEDKVEVGDMVEYEPCGMNFGWFVKVIKAQN